MSVPRAWVHGVDDPLDGVDRVCYEADTARAVLPASLCLSGFFLAFALLHHLTGAGAPSRLMDAVALASASVALGIAWCAWQRRIPDERAHAAMALLGVVTTLDVMVHLMLSGDADESVGFVLLMVGSGVVLLRRSWFVPAMAGIWAAWLVAITYLGGGVEVWGQWAYLPRGRDGARLRRDGAATTQHRRRLDRSAPGDARGDRGPGDEPREPARPRDAQP